MPTGGVCAVDRIWLGARRVPMGMELRRESKALPRVQLLFTLFNDDRYGGDQILRGERSASYKAFIQNCFSLCPRQALHAKTLGFIHPVTKQQMDFNSEWPSDLMSVIEKWRAFIKGTTRDTFEI